MAGQKLTEKALATEVKPGANILITQAEPGPSGENIESVRRLQLTALISALRKNGVNSGYVTEEALQALYPNLVSRLAVNEGGIEVTFADGTSEVVPIQTGGLAFDAISYDQESGYLHITQEGEDVVDPCFIGGGGGSSQTGTVVKLENKNGGSAFTIAHGMEMELLFTFYDYDSGGDYTGCMGALELSVDGSVVLTKNIAQGNHSLQVGEYLKEGTNRVKIKVTDEDGNYATKTWSITTISLSISAVFDDTAINTGDVLFRYTPIGNNIEKTIHFLIDGVESVTATVTASGRQQTQTIPAQGHGAHSLTVYATATVDGVSVTSNTLSYDVIWVQAGNLTPIIACSFQGSAKQFTTTAIPYMVYNPASLEANVVLSVDGEEVSQLTVDRTRQTWNYKPETSGEKVLTIACGSVVKTIRLPVSDIGIPVEPVTTGLTLDLNPTGRTNNDTDRLSFGYTDADGINHPLTFSDNFDWENGGFQTDENGDTYFCVKCGTSVALDRGLFEDDAMRTGKEIKIVFRAANCRDYDAQVASCMAGGVGMKLYAQKAIVKSEQTTMEVPYCEDSIIEMDMNVEPDSKDRVMMIWLEGVPSRCAIYAANDNFTQDKPEMLTIGSNDCDVHIYRIKAYGNDLTRLEIHENWIADAADAEEMLERYNRNNIYDQNGDIDVQKLIEASPELRVIVIDAERMTTGKKDKVTCRVSHTMGAGGAAHTFTGTDVVMKGQGTSSAAYGEAALNLDLEFVNGMDFSDGAHADTYSMTENSIGVNYFNIKLNVASSENANNVVLADEYNAYQPYINPARAADSRVRDTVEGHPCVVFYHNTSSETVQVGAISVPAGATVLYGCGDMNNSKKNVTVFGQGWNLEEYPLQCCIEISNNTNNQCLFKSDDLESETWDGDGSFEFRYPEEPSNAMKIAFQRVLSWVVRTDRTAATNGALAEPVTYGETTYTHDTEEYRAAKWLAEFDDYFVRDSVLYHYLFTERHAMIDNRSKNVFISTMDGVHWDFTKDYDNDTGDGNDNEGGLTLTYGLEDTDTIGTKDVFNASQNVIWCNVRDLMHDELQAMFITLESGGAWDAQRILAKFTAHQAPRPEALVIEDMWKKYIRPFTNSGTHAYLEMLYGTKADQRRQFETYQEKYMSSKYLGTVATADVITFRTYTPTEWVGVAPDDHITVTPYADMYINLRAGSGLARVRAKRGQPYTLQCLVDTLNDTETYLYGASNISDVGDLAPLYVGYFNIAAAVKLRHLKLGDATEGYSNTNAASITLGNNALLETLDIRNCPNIAVGLDLTGCTALTTLEAEGSGITGVSFARGGNLVTAHIPAVASLSAIALRALEDFTMTGYDALRTLRVENCPTLDVLAMVTAAADLFRIRLLGIDWQMANTDLLDRLAGLKGLDESDHNLEQSVLTGKAYVPVMRQSKLTIYREAWSDLAITYDTLVQQYLVTFKDWDGTVLYRVYVDRNDSAPDPVESGLIPTPTRESSTSTVYTYAGWDGDLTGVISARTLTVKYDESPRKYTVRWLDHLGTVLDTQTVDYGTDAVFGGDEPERTDEESMAVYYQFDGWNKSTGFVTGDIDVTALWERGELPAPGADTEALTATQIYAIRQENKVSDYFEYKDRVNITMGFEPQYTNIQHTDIADEMELDGETYLDTGIKLLSGGIGEAWTLVADLEYSDTIADATMLCCMQEDGYMGFKVRYVNGISVQWSTNSYGAGQTTYREIVVLRHEAGSRNLKVYSSKLADMQTGYGELTKIIDTQTDCTLVIGAAKSDAGVYYDYAKGILHSCRIWYGDLGDTDCRRIASWPRETYKWEAGTFGAYKLGDDASKSTNIDFICASLLSRPHRMNPTSTNEGGFPETEMLQYMLARVVPALPRIWQKMMQECVVNYMMYVDGENHNIESFKTKIWLPSYIEIQGGTSEPWIYEGATHIPYFTAMQNRVKFAGPDKLPREGFAYFAQETDPALNAANNVQDGDVWYNNTEGVTRSYLRYKGDWFAAVSFWLRGASILYGTSFCSVNWYGAVLTYGHDATYTLGFCPRFSI